MCYIYMCGWGGGGRWVGVGARSGQGRGGGGVDRGSERHKERPRDTHQCLMPCQPCPSPRGDTEKHRWVSHHTMNLTSAMKEQFSIHAAASHLLTRGKNL